VTSPRLAAARALLAVETGSTTLAAEIDRARRQVPDPRDRGLLVELATGTLRWRNAIDARLEMASGRSIADLDPRVRAILRIAIYQLRHLDRIPPHAVVHDAVDDVRIIGVSRAAGLVNAVLRAIQRDADAKALPERPAEGAPREEAVAYLSVALSHPAWLVERWIDRMGFEEAERWCRFNNTAPDLTVRSAGHLTAAQVEAELAGAGVPVSASIHVPGAWHLPPGALGRLPAALRAELAVQDEGSQLVAWQVEPSPGSRVLDLCAAPGGKTRVLADRLAGTGLIVAADWRPSRVRLLQQTVRSAATPVHVLRLDAREPLPFDAVFDHVLVDVPCSGTGVLRRDPDLKWTRQADDLPRFAEAARLMLAEAVKVLAPAGRLVYATCSSEPEENEGVVDGYLAEGHPVVNVPVPSPLADAQGRLRTRPGTDGMDAYFAAGLARSAAP
jgi:16S rRNA (cytosine967-C5)-methyltransferase